jgi:hypothetical protein
MHLPEPHTNLIEPHFQLGGLGGIGAPLEFDPATDFANHQNACMDAGGLDRSRPTYHRRMATLALAQFRNHVAVNKQDSSKLDVARQVVAAAMLEQSFKIDIRQVGAEDVEHRGRSWFGDDRTELRTHRLSALEVPTKNGMQIADNLGIDGRDLDRNAYHVVAAPATVSIQCLSLRVRHRASPPVFLIEDYHYSASTAETTSDCLGSRLSGRTKRGLFPKFMVTGTISHLRRVG